MRDLRSCPTILAAVLSMSIAAAGCSTPGLDLHTLADPARRADISAASAAPSSAASIGGAFEMLAVSVPEHVDRPQLVIQRPDGSMQLLEQQQWAAPLGSEITSALSLRLSERLGWQDLNDLGLDELPYPVYRVTVNVRRFDARPGGRSAIDADWVVRRVAPRAAPRAALRAGNASVPVRGATKDAAPPYTESIVATCGTRISFTAASDIGGLVGGMRDATRTLADRIADFIATMHAHSSRPPCPREDQTLSPDPRT